MLFDDIQQAVDHYCRDCVRSANPGRNCKDRACLASTINQIMNAHDIKVSKINIEDFFEEEMPGQISLFE